MLSVFDYDSYRDFLKNRLGKTGPSRGLRSKLAAHLDVKGAYISQVLGGKQNLSLEQAIQVTAFLELHQEEQDYFLLLVNLERAGTKKLSDYFRAKVNKIISSRKEIKSRVRTDSSVSEEDQLQYFSSWIYSALHVLITIPAYQEPKLMANRLGIPIQAVHRHLAFLEKIGIAEKHGAHYCAGKARFHIDRDHPQIYRHHLNWRERAILPLSSEVRSGQHYTCVMSSCANDVEKIKVLWLKFLESIEPIIEKSTEEEIFSIQWDFFKV